MGASSPDCSVETDVCYVAIRHEYFATVRKCCLQETIWPCSLHVTMDPFEDQCFYVCANSMLSFYVPEQLENV